jgi:3-deoxy-7-phosphoheptulonate synthase
MRQIDNAMEVLGLMKEYPKIKKLVKGLMIESYLEDGNQPIDGGVYGKSVTDPCLGWEKSKQLIYDINEKLEGLK